VRSLRRAGHGSGKKKILGITSKKGGGEVTEKGGKLPFNENGTKCTKKSTQYAQDPKKRNPISKQPKSRKHASQKNTTQKTRKYNNGPQKSLKEGTKNERGGRLGTYIKSDVDINIKKGREKV